METTFRKLTHRNVADIEYNSPQQAYSIFTLAAMFKDQNKAKLHSWRQEIRGITHATDHRNALERLKKVAVDCNCRNNPQKCFFHNHVSIYIYCNLTNTIVYKWVYGRLKTMTDCNFHTDTAGNTFLIAMNGLNLHQLSIAHAKANLNYNKYNSKNE